MAETAKSKRERGALDRLLNLFADVEPGEGATALLMFANIFLILMAYYVLKVVREALTIGGVSIFGLPGDEVKAYLPAVMAILLVVVVPAYGALASAMDRMRLIRTTQLGVIACLIGFWLWGRSTGVGTAIGLSFYVWLGIVNVFLIAQFWSYANDIYTEGQGERLFAIIAIGQSAGAIVGPQVAKYGKGDNFFEILLVCAALLGMCLALYTVVNRRVSRRRPAAEGGAPGESESQEEKPLGKGGGFMLVFKTRYLLLIALMILCTNVVNTTGEYILSNAAKQYSVEQVPELPPDALSKAQANAAAAVKAGEATSLEAAEKAAVEQELKNRRGAKIGAFYGDFFSIVNLVGLIIQMFFVSRIFKFFGVRVALFVLPVIAFAGYSAIGLIGGLLVLRIAKTMENATDYSLQNTIKQALFLPTSREAKYKAKAAIDTFFVRFGDAASAGIVAVGLHQLNFTARTFAFVNVVLALVWIALNVGIAREHKKLVPDPTMGAAKD